MYQTEIRLAEVKMGDYSMLAAIPVLCFLLTVLILHNKQILSWRGSFLLSAVLWGLFLTGLTELLSVFRWLDFWHVAAAWSMAGAVLLILLVFSQKIPFKNIFALHPGSIPKFELVSIACTACIVITIGIIAWTAPPNSWDSMTYHMSRVVFWAQNKSVAFYPTHIMRQLYLSPWSEFAILQFQLLAGNDRLANFIQWFSMLGSILGVSLLAKELKLDSRGQVMAAVISATIPMGILQSSSTQTDYVISFWLVCFIYFSLRIQKNVNPINLIGAGGALGLGVLTKATMYIFALPFLVWLGLSILKTGNIKKTFFSSLILLIAFLPNLGHYARNYDLYGSPLGPETEGSAVYSNEVFSLAAVSSNLIKNIGLHLSTPWEAVNTILTRVTASVHARILGISPSDPRTTWIGTSFQITRISLHEDETGNLIHLFYILAGLILFMLWRIKEPEIGVYVLCGAAAFGLFCAYLKWQPWNSRLHLPLFVVLAPFTAAILARIPKKAIGNGLVFGLLIMALPWLFSNTSRPVFGKHNIFTVSRNEQYFKNYPSLYQPYAETARKLAELDCSQFGIMHGIDDWEYPLWVLLKEYSGKDAVMLPVNVTNISQKKYGTGFPHPGEVCAVIVINSDPPDMIGVGDVFYSPVWSFDSVFIYTYSGSSP